MTRWIHAVTSGKNVTLSAVGPSRVNRSENPEENQVNGSNLACNHVSLVNR